jgi:small GTP-binding protein
MSECEIKTILIGDCNTGKTTLFRAFIEEHSERRRTEPTIAVDFSRRAVETDSYGTIVFQLWDTSGAEKFNQVSMTQMYYRNTQGVLLVFSVTDRASFADITEIWLRRLRSALPLDDTYKCILIGNKTDLVAERVVTTEEAVALAQQHRMDYIELSALDSPQTAIEQPFLMLAAQVIDANLPLLPMWTPRLLTTARNQEPSQAKCCTS